LGILFDHVEEKMMEVKFFLAAMDVIHAQHMKHLLALRRPFDVEGKDIARAFQFNFSAYLSAHRAVRHYIVRVSRKVKNTKQWRKNIDRRTVLNALHHLHDVDVHDETLNMSSGVRLRNLQTRPEVSTSDLKLHEGTLAANRRIAELRTCYSTSQARLSWISRATA
jgi:hypothetical protein